MQKLHTRWNQSRRACTLLLGAGVSLAPHAWGAVDGVGSGSSLTGVIRDASGVVQMGVLVEVLTPGATSVASAFTDDHGRYTFAHLLPGRYRVRATAALFAPSTRSVLELSGAQAVVNLTMSALFDTASWLPISPRRADEPDDEWKWTLRSSADRPILHFADDAAVRASAEASGKTAIHGSVQVSAGSGQPGREGLDEALTLQRILANGSIATMQMVAGAGGSGEAALRAMVERKGSFGGGTRTLVDYRSEPDVSFSGGNAGLQRVRFTNAQEIALGDSLKVEAGGNVEAVRAGSATLLTSHPFFSVTARPGGSWKVQYRLATERDLQSYEQVRADRDLTTMSASQDFPMAGLAGDGKVVTESGRHQEVSLARDAGGGQVEVAYFQDNLTRVAVQGIGPAGDALQSVPGLVNGLAGGQTNQVFSALVNGYAGNGARITYTAPVRDGLWIVAEYSVGNALSCSGSVQSSLQGQLGDLKARNSQTAQLSLRGKLRHSGTQVRASYRWQPVDDLTAVDPYDELNGQAFVGLLAKQQIRLGSWLPVGFEASVDISNLLAQGYRPFLSPDGKTLYLAQTPRSIQAGLAFNF